MTVLNCSQNNAPEASNYSTRPMPDGPENEVGNLGEDKGKDSLCKIKKGWCDSDSEVTLCLEGEARRGKCPVNTVCEVNEKGLPQCATVICKEGESNGCSADKRIYKCNKKGTKFNLERCEDGKLCIKNRCENSKCIVSERRCFDNVTPEVCNAEGVWEKTQPCVSGNQCVDGSCQNLCNFDNKISSYVGCEYWAVDLPNYSDAKDKPFAIVVTNINQSNVANVHFYEGSSEKEIETNVNKTLAPNEIRVFKFKKYDHSGTRKYLNKAIRLKSNIPVIAYQYNPLNNVNVYSNDGTVLLPTNAVGKEYYILSWTHRENTPAMHSFVTIVNSASTLNRVTVTPSAEILSGNGIKKIAAGQSQEFELQPGESLNLSSSGAETNDAKTQGCLQDMENVPHSFSPCPDLSGTHVSATEKITVFSGNECANVRPGVDLCDHIESIMIPVSSWGKTFVGTKFSPRSKGAIIEPDIYRIIAAADNTTIKTEPPIDGINLVQLKKGEWREFASRKNFVLRTDKPIMMAQYMVGSSWFGIPKICKSDVYVNLTTGIGDPAMSLVIPQAQWRKNYNVLTPESYTEDYLNIVALKDSNVLIDNVPITAAEWKTIEGDDTFKVAVVAVKAGEHILSGEQPFEVLSYGYACHVSYATPGGMNVEGIYNHLLSP